MGWTRRVWIVSIVACLSSLIMVGSGSLPAAGVTPLTFGLNTFPSGNGNLGQFTPEDAGRAASDLSPGSIVRFSVEWEWYQPGRRSNGATCLETDTPLVCTTPGPIDFAWLDSELSRLSAFNVRVILAPLAAPPFARNLGDWPTLVPASQRPHGIVAPPANNGTQLSRWQTFVRTLVQHVQSAFPGLLAGVEIWNEPNGQVFWTTMSGPDPARYKNVLCYGFSGVRDVSPTLPVIFAGTYPQVASDLPQRLTVPEFIGGAYAAGAQGCMTSLGIHPYGDLDQGNPVNGFMLAMQQARQAAATAGDAGRMLSITELGMQSWDAASQQAQRDFLIETYRRGEQMSDVNMYIVHTLFNAYDYFGVCAAPRVPKLAATALKNELTGSTAPATC